MEGAKTNVLAVTVIKSKCYLEGWDDHRDGHHFKETSKPDITTSKVVVLV
jgi:hypothetical protein